MVEVSLSDMLENADAAVDAAQRVRQNHRRRSEKKSPQRRTDIAVALQRLRDAMKPLRSEIGAFPYGPPSESAEAMRDAIRDRSAAIQSERRKLWKMLDRP